MTETNTLNTSSIIDGIEFIDLEPIDQNPLMSRCEIKVFYLGENRNGSYISKETAMKMAKTIRGCPIVGYFREDKQDFGDHGERITIDGDGLKVECLTMPYGFVSPDAQVYFKKFIEINDFGEEIEREYLLTTGYLWTGQFPEIQDTIKEGRPQSMELDRRSLDGHSSTNSKGIDFFIINDATLSKLCILGSDVEPCFEGAEVVLTEKYQYQDINFVNMLFIMAKELRKILKGDDFKMDTKELEATEKVVEENYEKTDSISEEEVQTEAIAETEEVETKAEVGDQEEIIEEPEEPSNIEEDAESQPASDFSKEKEQYELKIQKLTDAMQKLTEAFETQKQAVQQYSETIENYKNVIKDFEDREKDRIINKFSVLLEDAEMKDILDKKDQFSCEDLESRLSVVFSHKALEQQDSKSTDITSYTVNTNYQTVIPDWVKALKDRRK